MFLLWDLIRSVLLSDFYESHERFRRDREFIEGDERIDRPPTSKTAENIIKVKKSRSITANPSATIRELAEDFNVAYEFVQDIIVIGLCLSRATTKLIPTDLNSMQKRDHVDIAKYMISKSESDPTFNKRIIAVKMWVYKRVTQVIKINIRITRVFAIGFNFYIIVRGVFSEYRLCT